MQQDVCITRVIELMSSGSPFTDEQEGCMNGLEHPTICLFLPKFKTNEKTNENFLFPKMKSLVIPQYKANHIQPRTRLNHI